MNAVQKRWTLNEIRKAMTDAGSHWWNRGNMQFFGTETTGKVYQGRGGVYFVTSEQPPYGARAYTVRQFDPAELDVDTVGKLAGWRDRQDAEDEASRLAFGGDDEPIEIAQEKLTERTAAEQLAIDIAKNTGKPCTEEYAETLIDLATKHQKLMEEYCNGTFEAYTAAGNPVRKLAGLRKNIVAGAVMAGCKGVHFQGDPRGSTVKLQFHNGATNDWGKEGWCVPTSDDE